MKKLIRSRKLLLVLLIILIAFITKICLFEKTEYQEKNWELIEQDSKYYNDTLQDKSIKVKRVAESISKEIEIVVLKETGIIQLFHDKTPKNNKYIEWIIDSNITMKVYYTAILSIDTEEIKVRYDESEDKINIIYDLEKIKVSSVNIDNILSQTLKGVFGKQYSEKEITALTLIATNKIKEEISSNNNLKLIAGINLEEYLRNMAYKQRIFNVSIIQK